MEFWLVWLVLLPLVGCAPEQTSGPENLEEKSEAWNRAYQERMSGKGDSASCSGYTVPDRNGFDGRIALTFDDGPNPATTPSVLDVLDDHDAKGAFFMNGEKLQTEAQRRIARRIVEEGHTVGNHTFSHPNMRNLGADEARREVAETHALIQQFADPEFFRFPYGAADCELQNLIDEYGYTSVGWHIDSADWCFAGGNGECSGDTFAPFASEPESQYSDDMTGWVVRQAKRQNGGVILFHDIHPLTAGTLDTILTRLEEEGFTFVSLEDEEVFPHTNGVAPPFQPDSNPFVGSPCRDDSHCEFSTAAGDGWCFQYAQDEEDKPLGFCTVDCDGLCPDRSGEPGTFCVSPGSQSDTGICARRAGNSTACGRLPEASPTVATRYVDESNAREVDASVCLP